MLRIDASQLDAPERTDEGYIRAEGIIAPPGALEYRTKTGETVTEYVPEETLKDEEFLDSLEGKPVTLEHPPPDEPVTPENYRQYSVGHIQNVDWVDGPEATGVKGEVLLKDKEAIEAFESGTDELSPRYEVELVEHQGPEYDYVQAKRRAGNHVALTKSGRAGAKARLRADSDAMQADLWHADMKPLADRLSARIREMTDAETTQRDILHRVNRHIPGGRSLSALRSVVSGGVKGPPHPVLEAFATVLDLDAQTLKKATPNRNDSQPDDKGTPMPEKVRLDSERAVKVDEQTAQILRTYKQDMEDEQLELSSEIESAQSSIEEFKQTINELETERDELQKQIERKKKQLQKLADKMGLSDVMGGEEDPSKPGEGEGAEAGASGQPSGAGQPTGDGGRGGMQMPADSQLDSLIAERIDGLCRDWCYRYHSLCSACEGAGHRHAPSKFVLTREYGGLKPCCVVAASIVDIDETEAVLECPVWEPRLSDT